MYPLPVFSGITPSAIRNVADLECSARTEIALSADLSVFQNTSTLGDWSLIIVDDDASQAGSIGSWALTFNYT